MLIVPDCGIDRKRIICSPLPALLCCSNKTFRSLCVCAAMALVYVYAHGSPWLVYSYVRTLLSAWVLPAAAEGPNRICTPSERHHPVAASKPHPSSSLVSVFTSEGNRLAGRRRASPGARSHRSGRRARGRDRRGARRLWRTMSGCDVTALIVDSIDHTAGVRLCAPAYAHGQRGQRASSLLILDCLCPRVR